MTELIKRARMTINPLAKVLFVSSSYPQGENDWKSVFIRQMLRAIAKRDELDLTYWGPPGDVPEGVRYGCLQDEAAWLKRLMKDGGLAHLLRTGYFRRLTAPFQYAKLLRRGVRRHRSVDVYHVNWLQNALFLPRSNTPVVVTALGTDMKLLDLPGVTSALRRVFMRRRCILAPNAVWMVKELDKRFQNVVTEIIPVLFGIEQHWYDIKRDSTRKSPRKWVSVIRLTRKKVGNLFAWGEGVFTGKDELHLYGPNQEGIDVPDWVHYHGSVGPNRLAQKIYPEAYGYISLSQHDEGRPQAILEAMASGLPVIASNIDAHRDLLKNTKGGYLVDSFSDFSGAIKGLADMDEYLQSSRGLRDYIMKKHGTWDDCVIRYLSLYTKLVESNA